jgi:UDP-N-acetylglucosamine 2-epimerase
MVEMKKLKIALVIGTRPQIIKSAPIINEAGKHKEIEMFIVHTGQHYDYEMSKEFFNELSLPDPVVNLGVGSCSPVQQITKMMCGLEDAYNSLKPDIVLVPGDTNSTLAGALSAVKMSIPVVHVESGARSGDMTMPEEVNRRIVDHISSMLCAVSTDCITNLLNEGISSDKIELAGDTMYESIIQHKLDIDQARTARMFFGLVEKTYCVLTLHRESNVDDLDKLKSIINSIIESHMNVIFPCHPHTRKNLELLGINLQNINIVDPLPYFEMLSLVQDASVVITDSGGLQKEAFWLGTPCVTLRENTEWEWTIKAGANRLVGSDPQKIIDGIHIAQKSVFQKFSGLIIRDASKRIINELLRMNVV